MDCTALIRSSTREDMDGQSGHVFDQTTWLDKCEHCRLCQAYTESQRTLNLVLFTRMYIMAHASFKSCLRRS